jgi:methionyl-tRNA formyltransferase
MKYTIAIAGSTKNTVLMAEALLKDSRFEIVTTISPTAKLIGREQILTKNPLQVWSEKQKLPTFLVEKKLEETAFSEMKPVDFLLVVDFGYLIPEWLLKLPKIAPLNIHPSLLPKWRGSSPGQFTLLFQDLDKNGKQSAVTLMIMSQGLDEGPILAQLPFKIEENWTQIEYYGTAFNLMGEKLAGLISDFAEGKIQAQNQAEKSPTVIARRLNKEDSFIDFANLLTMTTDSNSEKIAIRNQEKALFRNLLNEQQSRNEQIKLVINASKAFFPWPALWTIVKTSKGEQRMQIFSCHLAANKLVLDQVQIEGKNPCLFNECKNALI